MRESRKFRQGVLKPFFSHQRISLFLGMGSLGCCSLIINEGSAYAGENHTYRILNINTQFSNAWADPGRGQGIWTPWKIKKKSCWYGPRSRNNRNPLAQLLLKGGPYGPL